MYGIGDISAGRAPAAVVAGFLLLASCGGDNPAAPPAGGGGAGGGGTEKVEFLPAALDLGTATSGSVELKNTGTRTVGPITVAAGPIVDAAGQPTVGSTLQVSPSQVATLTPGASANVDLSLTLASNVQSGAYRSTVSARIGQRVAASIGLDFTVTIQGAPPTGSVTITGGPATAQQGDVSGYQAEVRDSANQVVQGATVTWSVIPATAALIDGQGRFVGYQPGAARVVAASGSDADTLDLTITARAGPSGSFTVLGRGQVSQRFTSDHWEFGNAAYTGTWGCRSQTTGDRCALGEPGLIGNRLYVWDISSPSSPALTDSVSVDARVVNDVKVNQSGTLAVITHEVSNDGLNGVTLLDLSNPLHPTVITRVTDPALSPGIHNAWIDGNFVYLVVDGQSGLRVLDVSNPASPQLLPTTFFAPSFFLHDVYARNGLLFLSHWDAGLIILDVGNGIAGGSPQAPREVSRIRIPGYQVHNAWYWPSAGYVFVGDELSRPGSVRVIDVSDLSRPREVASLTIAGASPHNFWLDEARGIAYFAWYENGIQAVDVSGELFGQLEREGRRIAELQYGQGTGCFSPSTGATCTWAPQLHNGNVFLSDLKTGLWVLRPTF
ncbi:MAG: hypothetical protein ACE5HF_06125 [Gemmatimonadota bacterium]